MKRFLITTSLEDSWLKDKPVLFLGEWCRHYSREECWSKMDAQVLPYHWDNRAKLYDDYQQLQSLYERLLQDLTMQLNQVHDVDHNLSYWRILIGPWLGTFIQILFDRWTCIHNAICQFDLSGTIVLTGNEKKLVPNDTSDFYSRLIIGNEWDHYLYGIILQQQTKVHCTIKSIQNSESIPKDTIPITSLKHKIKRDLLRLYNRLTNNLSSENDAFFLTTYLPFMEELKMQFRLGQVPQFKYSEPVQRVNPDTIKRQWIVTGENRSEFEVFIRMLIPLQIPTAFLEGYNQLMTQIKMLQWPKKPKLIFTSNSHSADDNFKAWAAEKVEKGFPLVIGQHGGNFGTTLFSFNEDHEIAISTKYLSWGWSEPGQKKIAPVGQLKPMIYSAKHNPDKPGLLMITTTLPRKSYRLFSAFISRQWLDYFADNCTFVNRLPNIIRKVMTVRLHPQDRGWDQIDRWRDHFPELSIEKGQCRIKDLIPQNRLVICTYNATTFLELFNSNIPTIIFWNSNHWELRESALPYFKDLKRVGIFHETPASAADHVAIIWNDIESWWNSPEVKLVLDRFKKRYCYRPQNILNRVESALWEAIHPQNN